jgi:hypothetical protein
VMVNPPDSLVEGEQVQMAEQNPQQPSAPSVPPSNTQPKTGSASGRP